MHKYRALNFPNFIWQPIFRHFVPHISFINFLTKKLEYEDIIFWLLFIHVIKDATDTAQSSLKFQFC